MKKVVLFLIIISSGLLTAQKYEAKPIKSYSDLIQKMRDSSSSEIYLIDEYQLDTLIKSQKDIKYHLIYIFAFWCKPCVEKMYPIIQMARQSETPLYIINIEKNNSTSMRITQSALQNKFLLNIPTFAYNFAKKMGHKKRVMQFQKFFQYYLKEQYDKKYLYGYSGFLLLDGQANLIFSNATTSLTDVNEVYEKLSDFLEGK